MNILTRRGFLATSLAAAVAPAAFLRSARGEDGVVELTARPFEKSIPGGDAPASLLWGYQGQTPGPLLRARQGETLRVRFRNELPEPSSIHWHGVRVDNAMDGVAGLTQEPVPPGETFEYAVKLPDAGTFWYHAHTMSWNQVARGLYGPLIVDEAETPFAPEHDILLMLDDWRLDARGRFDEASLGHMMDWSHAGRLGNYLTVNGAIVPEVSVPANAWLRLRLINACNSRILEINPGRFGARVIAYDGQPVGGAREPGKAPLLLGPAQRVDLLARFDTAGPVALEEVTGPYRFATLDVRDSEAGRGEEPALVPNKLPAPDLQNARTFKLVMEGGAMGRMGEITYNGRVQRRMDFMTNKQFWAFNGVANMAPDPFFSVARGETVVIDVVNGTNFAHAMHVHGHHFKVLERNGTPDAWQDWRDTFLTAPEGVTKIAFVADNPGKWLFHCHMLEHAAAGMTTWFEIT